MAQTLHTCTAYERSIHHRILHHNENSLICI